MGDTTSVRVGMGQVLVEPGEPAANLRRAVAAVDRAAAEGCDVVVLPECLDLGWTFPGARELAGPVPGPVTEVLGEAAARGGLLVAAGMVERSGDRLHNAAVLLSPDGDLLLHHRKVNELDIALDLYTPGTSLQVAPTPLGPLGLDVCADNLPGAAPLGQAIGHLGARLLVSPSAWAVRPDHDEAAEPYGGLWRDAYAGLASAFRMPVVGVSNVGPVRGGPWDGWRCIGCSLAVGPGGEVLARLPYGEEAFAAVDVPVRDLDEVPGPVRRARAS